MKKFVSFCFLFAILSAFACGGNCGGCKNNGTGGTEDEPAAEYGSRREFEENSDFSVTYAVSDNGIDVPATAVLTKTAGGVYIASTSGGGGSLSETLYLKNGEGYDHYLYLGGKWVKQNAEQYSLADVDKAVGFSIFAYVNNRADNRGDMENAGTEQVIGRNCDKYSGSFSYMGTNWTESYLIDQLTGVCLKFSIEYADGTCTEYACTEFKTSGAVLPVP